VDFFWLLRQNGNIWRFEKALILQLLGTRMSRKPYELKIGRCPPAVGSIVALVVAGVWLDSAELATEARAEDGFQRCMNISANQARLDCIKQLLPTPSTGTPTAGNGTSDDLWPVIKAPRPNGPGDAVAIMRTADTSQSDPDLAGLMLRCGEKSKIEVLLALVRPVPPRSKRDVSINLDSAETVIPAEALPTGMALVLPIDGTIFTTGPWRELKQLSVRIHDPDGDIRGTISLEGLGPAMARLGSSCP
jgi:hypothetical protein